MAAWSNPTLEQVRCFLVDDNDWTEEEFAEFIEDNAALVQGEDTLADRDQWESLAMMWVAAVPDESPDLMNDDHWNESRGK